MKTRILLTLGDYNGIGPEIILKTLSVKTLLKKYDITVISPVSVLEFYAKKLRKKLFADDFNVIPIGSGKLKITPGKISDEAGFVSGFAVIKALEFCMNGDYDALVTAPLSKEALNLGGFNYDGHTALLKDFGKANEVCMMMVSDKLKVSLATNHPPLNKVSAGITKKLLHEKLKICYSSLKNDFRISSPTVGVLSLNPHAGDGGVIGSEEIDTIIPAMAELRKNRGAASFAGPFAADTYFASAMYEKYDLTFAMYHDQGLIPFKMVAGMKGINYTAGLSFVRTSPDHGTAFNIAGKNKANERSFIEAIKWADKLFRNRNR